MEKYTPKQLTDEEIETLEMRERWRQAILVEREAKMQEEINRRILMTAVIARPKMSRNKEKSARKARRKSRRA